MRGIVIALILVGLALAAVAIINIRERSESTSVSAPIAEIVPIAPPAEAPPPEPRAPEAPAVPAAEAPTPNVLERATPEPPAVPLNELPAQELPAPSFDIVRINPEGGAVIAGRAAPNVKVNVNVDGITIATTQADAFGDWLVVLEDPLEPGPQELTLRSVTPEGFVQRSDQVVTVVVPGANAEPGERTIAVLQDQEGEEAPRVMVGAINDPGVRTGELTLEAIRYDDEGNVILTGKAKTGTNVRMFVDDVKVGQGMADNAGLWQLTPDRPLDVGRHELRLEQLDDVGGILSKVELPFMRAESLGLAPGEVIVQPGTNLWRIARSRYGKGTMYTMIFLANADQIDDPELIYPGQIFKLPSPPDK